MTDDHEVRTEVVVKVDTGLGRGTRGFSRATGMLYVLIWVVVT